MAGGTRRGVTHLNGNRRPGPAPRASGPRWGATRHRYDPISAGDRPGLRGPPGAPGLSGHDPPDRCRPGGAAGRRHRRERRVSPESARAVRRARPVRASLRAGVRGHGDRHADAQHRHRGGGPGVRGEADRPGFSVGKLEHKLGIRGSPTGQPIFEDVRVPAENMVGTEGQGFKVAMATLDHSRLGVAAQALGIAQGATDYAASYARERRQFGRPINSFQGIQFKLADMETKCAAARELLYKACAKIDRGDPDVGKYSAMAKLFCSDVAMRVTVEAVQVLGGYGYVKEYPVERMMRDAKITQIYEGTNEIQRLVIARTMR